MKARILELHVQPGVEDAERLLNDNQPMPT
jgi:hypothetical protein